MQAAIQRRKQSQRSPEKKWCISSNKSMSAWKQHEKLTPNPYLNGLKNEGTDGVERKRQSSKELQQLHQKALLRQKIVEIQKSKRNRELSVSAHDTAKKSWHEVSRNSTTGQLTGTEEPTYIS